MSARASEIKVSLAAQNFASENDFSIKSCKFSADEGGKLVKIAVIQTKFPQRSKNFGDNQRDLFESVEKMMCAAVEEKANIVAFPELFSMPYPFFSLNPSRWNEIINADRTEEWLLNVAKKFTCLIVGSILEQSEGKIFNTCILISTNGKAIGKYRKHHIPPIEAPYLSSGAYESPVFDTEFGKIAVLICYERHFPIKYSILSLKGAEIIFNISSEDNGNSLSERMWFVENFNAAVSSGIFTVAINRCGEEIFGAHSVNYFGSSYVASPFGFITPPLFRQRRGILIVELDLCVARRAREEISFHTNQNVLDFVGDLSHFGKKE